MPHSTLCCVIYNTSQLLWSVENCKNDITTLHSSTLLWTICLNLMWIDRLHLKVNAIFCSTDLTRNNMNYNLIIFLDLRTRGTKLRFQWYGDIDYFFGSLRCTFIVWVQCVKITIHYLQNKNHYQKYEI